MKNVLKPLVVIFLFVVVPGCKSKNAHLGSVPTPLISKDTTNENERNNALFVFVGEKIDTTSLPYEPGDFDAGIKAKYRVLEKIYGEYADDIIEFESYDHFGSFSFVGHQTVLLFVSEHSGKYYHEKYIYEPLYKTKDGRFAGPVSDEYQHEYNKDTKVKPEKIDFAEEVSFPAFYINENGNEIPIRTEPYFKIVGKKAIAIYGNYVKELFLLNAEGVLTARKLFGNEPREDEK